MLHISIQLSLFVIDVKAREKATCHWRLLNQPRWNYPFVFNPREETGVFSTGKATVFNPCTLRRKSISMCGVHSKTVEIPRRMESFSFGKHDMWRLCCRPKHVVSGLVVLRVRWSSMDVVWTTYMTSVQQTREPFVTNDTNISYNCCTLYRRLMSIYDTYLWCMILTCNMSCFRRGMKQVITTVYCSVYFCGLTSLNNAKRPCFCRRNFSWKPLLVTKWHILSKNASQ